MEVSEVRKMMRKVFDPLATRLNLDGPIELSLTPTDVHLGYTTNAIGLEIEVETVDFFIYALIFRPSGHGLPLGYNDETGKRHKLYVQQALKELSIDVSRETRELQLLGGDYRNCQEMADKLARLIEHYWPAMSQNSTRWFS
jgi:hypothetical protein